MLGSFQEGSQLPAPSSSGLLTFAFHGELSFSATQNPEKNLTKRLRKPSVTSEKKTINHRRFLGRLKDQPSFSSKNSGKEQLGSFPSKNLQKRGFKRVLLEDAVGIFSFMAAVLRAKEVVGETDLLSLLKKGFFVCLVQAEQTANKKPH